MSSSTEKMEVNSKISPVIKKEKEEELHLNVLASQNVVIKEEVIQPNAPDEKESKMDVDADKLPVPDETKKEDPACISMKEIEPGIDETKKEDPACISMKEIEPGLVRLSIDGIEDDDEEEEIVMSSEEVNEYLEQKLKDYLVDPTVNPLLQLTKRSQELQEEFKEKNEEYNKLNKLFDLIYRNQEKFLRHMGILPKIPTKSVAVCVDMPVIPDTIPPLPKASIAQKSTKENVVFQNAASILIGKSGPPAPTPSTSSGKEPVQTPDARKNISKPSSANIECIDLTDETDLNIAQLRAATLLKHPAPLPPRPYTSTNKKMTCLPPRPRLKVHAEERGIVLQWDVPQGLSQFNLSTLCAFDIYGYQEQPNVPINTLLWKKIGSVKAMTLPMACTLTQFLEGHRYHFAIRAMDSSNRYGHFSDPISIIYTPRPQLTGKNP